MKIDLSFLHISALTLVGLATVIGYYMGRGAQRTGFPALIGYMFLGVVLGPSVLNILDEPTMELLSFLSKIGLGFVAFSIGSELHLSTLKRFGISIVTIIFAETFMAFLVVVAAIYLLTGDLALAVIFGAMAPASAPAGTVAVIQECRAQGSLTKALYAVVGFDDGLAVIIFGFAAAFAKFLLTAHLAGGQPNIVQGFWLPLAEIMASLLLGGGIGLIFSWLASKLHNSADILILIFGFVFLATGLSERWDLSLILTNMMIGFVLVNTKPDSLVNRVRAPLLEIMPLVFILFFCLAGAHLEISAIPALSSLGIVYILGRSAGLIGGAHLGALVGGSEKKIKKYLGLGILSQAGVAIGLSLIIKNDLSELASRYNLPHAAEIGSIVLTTITITSFFFEVVGPILTKYALHKAGEIPARTRRQKRNS